jgi:hypothetical protein
MVMALLRGAIGILALLVIPAVARADDISATGRSVVRVVTVTIEDDQVTDFGHGSGFAVSRNRILTNAHVVAAAARDPDSVGIGIVPSQGSRAAPPGADRDRRGDPPASTAARGRLACGVTSAARPGRTILVRRAGAPERRMHFRNRRCDWCSRGR